MYKFITIKDFATILASASIDTLFHFNYNESEEDIQNALYHEGWYGAKKIRIFDEPNGVFVIGNYDGGETICIDLSRMNHEEIIDNILSKFNEFSEENLAENRKICVEVTDENKRCFEKLNIKDGVIIYENKLCSLEINKENRLVLLDSDKEFIDYWSLEDETLSAAEIIIGMIEEIEETLPCNLCNLISDIFDSVAGWFPLSGTDINDVYKKYGREYVNRIGDSVLIIAE